MRGAAPLTAALLLFALPAGATPYTVDQAASHVAFSGMHADTPFKGHFDKWAAAVDFDAANPAASKISATFDLASAVTGNKMFDGTLPQADWFDVKNTPQAEFTSTAVAQNADGSYQVDGDLTLRGITRPVSFAFRLDDPAGETLTATAQLPLERLAFDIGKKSDPDAEWVGKIITVDIALKAHKGDVTPPAHQDPAKDFSGGK